MKHWNKLLLSRKIAFVMIAFFSIAFASGVFATADNTRTAIEIVGTTLAPVGVVAAIKIDKDATPEQIAEQVSDKFAEYDTALKEGVKIADLQPLRDEIKALSDQIKLEGDETLSDQFKSMLDKLKTQGLEMAKLTAGKPEQKKTLKDVIKEIHPKIMEALSGQGGKYELPINKTTVTMSSFTDDPAGLIIPGFAEIQTQRNVIAQAMNTFPVGPDSHGIVRWTDWTTATSGAAARSDGDAAGESVAAWTGYSQAMESISDSIPVHLEALRDVVLMEGELRDFLTNNLQVKEDTDLYAADGSTPNIKGIYTFTTAFDAAAYLAAGGYAVESANLADLIISMAAQIMKASKYMVNTVLLNPYDALKLKLIKDSNGNYVLPPFMVRGAIGEFTIDNMKVVQSNSVTVNTCVVGDFTYARRYVGENIDLSMGYNTSGDFTKRIITLLANVSELLVVRNAEVDAFLKSTDIDNDINAIESSAA